MLLLSVDFVSINISKLSRSTLKWRFFECISYLFKLWFLGEARYELPADGQRQYLALRDWLLQPPFCCNHLIYFTVSNITISNVCHTHPLPPPSLFSANYSPPSLWQRLSLDLFDHCISMVTAKSADDSSKDLLYSSQSMASISTVNSVGEIFSDKAPLITKNKR